MPFFPCYFLSQSKCLFHGYQDKFPELVVLTAASAKLVAKVFIRAGRSTQEAGTLRGFTVSAPNVCTTFGGQRICSRLRPFVILPCADVTAVGCLSRNIERSGRGHKRRRRCDPDVCTLLLPQPCSRLYFERFLRRRRTQVKGRG